MFHRPDGPRHWANARLVRYADDFVILARYQGQRIKEWLDAKLEGWLGLNINREKTKVVNLADAESLDFLGYTFRFDSDLHGNDKTDLNVMPSKKSLKKARDAIRQKTGPKNCYNPTPEVVKDLNTFLRGWSNYFGQGYPRKAFRDVSHYARQRMVTHLNRRSLKEIPPLERDEPLPIPPRNRTDTPMMKCLQESRMREIRTSGLTRGSNGIGESRPLLSTLPV